MGTHMEAASISKLFGEGRRGFFGLREASVQHDGRYVDEQRQREHYIGVRDDVV